MLSLSAVKARRAVRRVSANTVEFSHDGGATFESHGAPAFGPVASPNRDAAVVVAGNDLYVTTDDGATWHVVTGTGKTGAGTGAVGFVTPTEGDAILATERC